MRLLRSWLKNLCNSWNGLRRQSPPAVRRQRPTLRPMVETLEDRLAPAGTGTGLLGQYYNGQNFNSLVTTRTDSTVYYDWTGKAPVAGLSSTNYSVRWTGQLEALYSERTILYVYSDDGARLKINGKTVIDAWADHTYREDTYAIQLVAGQKYQIELEYKQNTGAAAIRLAWLSASQPWTPIQSKQLYASATVPAPAPAPAATTALRGTLAAGNVTAAGGTNYTFNVTYGGGPGLQTSSLGADVRVTGPNGYSQSAGYAGIVGSSAAGVTVRYQVAAPGGSWDAGDNGSYTVSLLANEVRD
ncbi:MAG: hypothetical protein JNM56_13120, partial [Planctomycetia bacterium]|nr:hypothetical protein [Planctomycetia bacterium]